MFRLFRWKSNKTEIDAMHGLLRNSFQNVKRDTAHISNWLNFFHQKSLRHDQHIAQIYQKLDESKQQNYYLTNNLKSEIKLELGTKLQQDIRLAITNYHLSHYHKIQDQLSQVIDSSYSLESISSHMKEIQAKLRALEYTKSHSSFDIGALDERIRLLEQKKKDVKANLREKLLKKITKNSKEYIKNLIISLIRKYGKVSGLQLKDMIVEEQGLCSKSSFYRILGELDSTPEVSIVRKGKDKIYLSEVKLSQ